LRALEKACRFDVRFWVLTGQLTPDHNTFQRFLFELREDLPWMMQRFVEHAKSKGLVSMRVVAVDGTKVAADVSHWRRATQEMLESEPPEESPVALRSARGERLCGFNVQVAVDADSGMVVGDAVLQDKTDHHAMPAVLKSIEKTAGTLPVIVVADAGYDSSETHTELARRDVLGVVVPQGREALFWSLDENGRPVCPIGKSPVPKGGYTRGGRRTLRYVVPGCSSCPLQDRCKAKTGKTIYVPQGTRASDRIMNAQRFEEPAIQALAKTRGPTVEVHFARLKAKLDRNRFATRTKSAVHAEFRLFCLSENIRKLLVLCLGLIKVISNRQRASHLRIFA